MKCQENRQRIHTYLDGELSTYEERSLYGHLASCRDCQLDMERARNLHHELEKSIVHVEPPNGFSQRVLANLPERANLGEFAGNPAPKKTNNPGAGSDIAAILPKEEKKNRGFGGKYWVAAVAGLFAAVVLLSGLGQVAQIGIDPKAEDGYFVWITPKEQEELITAHGEKPVGPMANEPTVENPVLDGNPALEVEQPGNQSAEGGTPSGEGNQTEPIGEQNTQRPEQVDKPVKDTPEDNFEITEPIVVANATGSVTLAPFADAVASIAWKVDGLGLLYLQGGDTGYTAYESTPDGTEKKTLGSFSGVGRWNANKEYLVYSKTTDSVQSLWIETRDEAVNLTPDAAAGARWDYQPVWSADNEVAFVTDAFGGMDIMAADLQGNTRRLTSTGDKKEGLAWSPDGKWLAYTRTWDDKGVSMREVVVVAADGSRSQRVTPAVKASRMTAAWSPDGKLLAVNVAGEQQGVWMTESTSGQAWVRPLSSNGGGKMVSWAPDGQKIVFTDEKGTMHIAVLRAGQAEANFMQIVPTAGQMNEVYVEWSKDSRQLLIEQGLADKNEKKAWVATLPKSVTAY